MTKKERFLSGEDFYLPNSGVLYSFSDDAISGFSDGVVGYSTVVDINNTGFVLNVGYCGEEKLCETYSFALIRFKKDENAIGEPVIATTDENQLNLFQTN